MKLELSALRVIGCGPLRDVCIDFRDASGKVRPVTVLGGANGSGKTTALELIAALSKMLDQSNALSEALNQNRLQIPSILTHTTYAQMDLLVDDRPFSRVYGNPPSDAALPHNYVITRTGGLQLLFEDSPGYNGPPFSALIYEQKTKPVIFVSDQRGQPSADQLALPSVLYIPHHRVVNPVRGDHVNREETTYQWVYRYETVNEFEGSLDSYLVWLDYAEPEVFTRVRDFLNSLDFGGKTFSINRKELKAVVNLPDGSHHFLEDLSSGEQNILIMLLELRRRLLPHGIVLIDEIENSLHPAYQHKLAQALLKMKGQIPFQLIVTTHAPAFVEIFGPESTLLLTEF